MKLGTDPSKPPSDSVFPLIVEVNGVESLNYNINLETVEPWSDKVVKHNNVSKRIRMLGSTAPCEKNISDKQQFIELVKKERQLMEDFRVHAERLDGFDKPIDIQLQRYALIIYLAKSWEDWAFQMHQMFTATDTDAAEKQFKYVYTQYAIPYYQEAIECLIILGRSLPPDTTEGQKQVWGNMFVYAKNQYITTVSLYKDEESVRSTQEHYKHIDSILVNNGMGHLVPDYKPEVKNENGLFDGVKELIWSAWQGMCGVPSQQQNTRYSKLSMKEDKEKSRVSPSASSMSREEYGIEPKANRSSSSLKQKKY